MLHVPRAVFLPPQRLRRKIGRICFCRQIAERNLLYHPDRFLIVLIRHRATYGNGRALFDVFLRKLCASRIAVKQDGRVAFRRSVRTFSLPEPGLSLFGKSALLAEYVKGLLVRFPCMYHYRHFQIICKSYLPAEPLSLILPVGKIVVKIQSDLAYCNGFRVNGQLFYPP